MTGFLEYPTSLFQVHWHPDVTKEQGQAFLRRLKKDLPTLQFLNWYQYPMMVTPDVYVSVRHSAGILTVPCRYVLPTLRTYLETSVKVLHQLPPQVFLSVTSRHPF